MAGKVEKATMIFNNNERIIEIPKASYFFINKNMKMLQVNKPSLKRRQIWYHNYRMECYCLIFIELVGWKFEP